jgi:hypothetical protein
MRTVLMDSDKRSAQVKRLEVVETGRRRRWSEDEKLKIVLESLQAPRQVAATARRYGICCCDGDGCFGLSRRIPPRNKWAWYQRGWSRTRGRRQVQSGRQRRDDRLSLRPGLGYGSRARSTRRR